MNTKPTGTIPFYRDIRKLALIAQGFFLVGVALLALVLYTNLMRALRQQGLDTSFDFLWRSAGFTISEGPEFFPEDTYLKAYGVGVYNTVRVALLGVVFATLIGVGIGIARLSRNFLVSWLAALYVETLRNTPLLVQLVFWYFAVILKLPDVQDAILVGPLIVSNRGLNFPWWLPTDGAPTFLLFLIAGLVLGVILARRARVGPWWTGLVVFALVSAAGYRLAGNPLRYSLPELGAFRVTGGASLSPEFFALLVGLTVYTAAFIAEIVRAGIQAVPRGQWEAARALGLKDRQTLAHVIMPQALRVMIPPLGNQYLNLTKNSSLAIAVGYPDLFNVAGTMINQSGRSVQVILMIMVTYLTLSLVFSAGMNRLNRRLSLETK